MAKKSSRVNVADLFPDDQKLVSRNLGWRNIITKYSSADRNTDETGFMVPDALKIWQKIDHDEDTSSASDVQEDDDAGSDSSYDYKDVQKQLSVVKKERSKKWQMNGLSKILNDVHFKLDTDVVNDWLSKNMHSSNKQVVVGRESQITTQEGDSTINLSCASNLTIVNGVDQNGILSENRSNYEMSSGNKKIIVHQVEKTILTTVTEITTEGYGSAHHGLSFGSFPGFNVPPLPLFQCVQGFKIPNPIDQHRFLNINLPALKDSACHKKNENMNAKRDKENVSQEHKCIQRKSSRVLQKERQKKAPKTNVKESACRNNGKKQHQRKKSCSDDEEDSFVSSYGRTSDKRPPLRRGTRRIIEDSVSSSDDEETLQSKQKQIIEKSIRQANEHTEAKKTGKVDASLCSQQQVKALDIPFSATANNKASANDVKRDAEFSIIISSSNDESVEPAPKQKNISAHCKPVNPDNKLTKLTNSSSTKPVTNIAKPSTQQQTISTAPSNASDGKPKEQKPNKLPVEDIVRDSNTTPEPMKAQKYCMPEYYQKQLSKDGRCGYKIEGIVIYKPKNIPASAMEVPSVGGEKIVVTERDLDLSAVCETRRHNFTGFRKHINRSSTLVYYMTDSEVETDDDDDDPISNFHPLVVYEFKHFPENPR
ncbi:uncharacterized protein LOC131282992 [Anopheles ziemanni]|uniref:uncharacterized protein LOC131267069 n=1 Tax=Anopheles coustani TaxID=139045 RepID=UPI00265A616A|nr:uncharacterized protein LOC131267069 [Anopheles coustani]XP_058168534.1 uncharacterized protein LOC131282992 [Anopheles ziemanni]